MNLNKLNKMQKLAKRIGIRTFGELYDFKKREQQPNETLLQTLTRYNNELGADFSIREV